MSELIDELVKHDYRSQRHFNGDGWYLTKSIRYFSWSNIVDAWRVLIGKSRAYHYKEDED